MGTYDHFAGQKVARVEALSDGVFAVALTLLVLEIKVPHDEGGSDLALLHALRDLLPKFLSYFLSFMTLGIFWTGHSAQLAVMERYDRHLTWISLLFLLFVSLLPFSTAFLGEHVHFKVAIGLYWAHILALGLLVLWHWKYACRHGYVELPEERLRAMDRAITRRVRIAQLLYALGALLCFISPFLSIGFIVCVQLNYAFAVFFRAKDPAPAKAPRHRPKK